MAKNLLVINVDIRETRVALIENGIIAELHIERESSRGTLGNIYLGKVSRVLPGMQAAFIDVGLERAAFLHVEDLIRPDDFEAYLAGHRRGTTDEDRASGPAPEAAAEAEIQAEREREKEREREREKEREQEAAAAAEAEAEAEAADADDDEPQTDQDDDDSADVPDADATIDEASMAAAFDERAQADEVAPSDESVDVDLDAVAEEEADDAAPNDAADDADDAGEDAFDLPRVEVAPIEGAEGIAIAQPVMPSETSGEVIVAAATEMIEAGKEASLGAPNPGDAPAPAPIQRVRGRRGSRGRVRRSGSTSDRRAEQAPQAEAREGGREPQPQQPQQGQRREGGGRDGGGRNQGRDGNRRGRQGGRDGGGRNQGRQGGRDGGGRNQGRDGRDGGRDQQRAGSKRQNEPPRISKTTPIREVVREGQDVIVQVSKEPIGSKGARVTSHISLPGRYVVYLPTVEHIGISKRIGSERERARLRESIEAMKPPQGGLIVRTLAEGLTKKQLKADVGYLVRLWGEIAKKREESKRAPACIYTELDLVLKTARDLFTDDIEKIVIDSPEEHQRLRRFVEMFLPERADAVELYDGEEPIFDAYGIEDEIARAQSRKVPLASGGHLIIDQAEALTAIDVNTGRFVGKGSRDLEETILMTNLEAVEEIAYQLRFRNIGGLIILDLIDMERAANREKVRKRLEELLARDKAKTTLNRISDLGLIEMTRKRTRESLGRTVLEPCFYCDGTGQLQSKQTVAYEILRQIRRERQNLRGYSIVVNAHPAVIDLLRSDEKIAVQEAERLFQRRIELVPRKEYHVEQFDLQGK